MALTYEQALANLNSGGLTGSALTSAQNVLKTMYGVTSPTSTSTTTTPVSSPSSDGTYYATKTPVTGQYTSTYQPYEPSSFTPSLAYSTPTNMTTSPIIATSEPARDLITQNTTYLTNQESSFGAPAPTTPISTTQQKTGTQTTQTTQPTQTKIISSTSATNPALKSIIDQANQILNDPQIQAVLTPELRSQISSIQGLEVNNQNLASSARSALDNGQYSSFNSLIEQMKANQQTRDDALKTLYAGLTPLREKYLASLTPGQGEIDLQNQLVDIQKKIQDFDISAQEGQQAEFGLGRPLAISTGRAEKLGQQANLQRQTFLNEQNNLLTRLGLAQEARKFTSEGLKAGMEFALQDADIAMKVQTAQEDRENKIFERAVQLNTIQRQQFADILDTLKGVNPEKFSLDIQNSLQQLATARGIPYDLLKQGLQASYDSSLIDQQLKQAQITKTLREGTLLGVTDPTVASWVSLISRGSATLANVPESLRNSVVAALEEKGVNVLGTTQRNTLQALGQASGIVDQLDTLFGTIKDQFASSPLGRLTTGSFLNLSAFLQTNPDATQFNTFKEGILSTLSRATGERGVLTDQDIQRVRNLLPNLTDTQEVAESKLKQLDTLFGDFTSRALSTFTGTTTQLQGMFSNFDNFVTSNSTNPFADL